MQKYLLAKKRLGEVMRICTLQIVITTIASGMALAHPGYAQKVLDKEVTISLTEITIENALREIELAANVKFIYSPERLKLTNETISLKVEKKKLGDVLSDLLTPRGIEFIGDSKNDFVTLRPSKKKEAESGSKKTSSLESEPELRPNSSVVSFATITGVVTDGSTNLPMPGVNVIVKGTTNGTSTDSEGRYTISAEDNGILVFSFIGFTTQEVQVSGRSMIDVTLAEDAARLNEVVVKAGYWDVKERERTGNISRVTSTDIQKQPVANVLSALQGRMPGLYIQQRTGVPGGGFDLQIRGRNSLRTGGNSPLYVIDGNPILNSSITTYSGSQIVGNGNVFNNINPSDIESVEVLKDADATAIYGSRGANGVVLITTRKANQGKTNIDLNVYSGFGKVTNKLKLLNSAQWVEMRHEAFKNDGATPQPWDFDVNGAWDTTRYTDWQRELIGGTAKFSKAQINVSGGDRNTNFLFTGSYYKESTVFPRNFSDQRGYTHLTLNHTSQDEKFLISFSNSFSLDNNNLPRTDLTGFAMQLSPVSPALYDETGQLNWANGTWINPLSTLLTTYKGDTKTLLTNANASYKVMKDMSVKLNGGYTSIQSKDISTIPISSYNPASWSLVTGEAFLSNNTVNSWNVEPQIDYQKRFGTGRLSFVLGSTFQQTSSELSGLYATGYRSDALIGSLSSASAISSLGYEETKYRYSALFGRINISLKDKLFFNLTGRRDGSSRFGKGNQYGTFGALGSAWIFSEENFFKKLGFLSLGKLRFSYGITGSDQVGDYGYFDTYTATTYPYQDVPGLSPTALANPNYGWETSVKMEGALQIGLFDSRLQFDASYYRNRTSNQLVGEPLPFITGFASIQNNFPAKVQNTGWEFQLNTININGANVGWTTSLNLTIPRNKLLEYPSIESSSWQEIYKVGQPLSIQSKLRYTGVDPQTGIYSFEDKDGDGSISIPQDKQFLKQVAQTLYGGFQNSLTFKNIQLDIFFQFVKQTGWDYTTGFYYPPGSPYSNQPTSVMNRWQKEGDQSHVQKFTQGWDDPYIQYTYAVLESDMAIVDASFIRLKNISLSYNLPDGISQKLKLSKSRIYVQGQNILTLTKFGGLDPENQSIGSSNVLPALSTYIIGVQITL